MCCHIFCSLPHVERPMNMLSHVNNGFDSFLFPQTKVRCLSKLKTFLHGSECKWGFISAQTPSFLPQRPPTPVAYNDLCEGASERPSLLSFQCVFTYFSSQRYFQQLNFSWAISSNPRGRNRLLPLPTCTGLDGMSAGSWRWCFRCVQGSFLCSNTCMGPFICHELLTAVWYIKALKRTSWNLRPCLIPFLHWKYLCFWPSCQYMQCREIFFFEWPHFQLVSLLLLHRPPPPHPPGAWDVL